ncbi:YfiR family protein [Luteimonas sp. SDU82]|uniref:YfiR family protein n=1 Tax=Luteimonas sp. SDU82 TaxID=3422592 RepID=UPI003EB88FD1
MALLAEATQGRQRRRAPAALLAALGLGTAGAGHAQVDEHALKAAFVYNIAAFADWGGAPDQAVILCVQTGPQLDAALAAMAGRTFAGRRVEIARTPPAAGCDVLVQDAQLPPPAPAARLVICDACQLPDGSSTVALVREGNRIRFDVDAARARADGVTLSSQLLRLARRVL